MIERTADGLVRSAKGPREFEASDARILRVEDQGGLVRAVAPGIADLSVRAAGTKRVYRVVVQDPPQEAISAIHHTGVDTIIGEDLLFVGHANRDGFDHTAVAKPGIDRWVRESKDRSWRVVYWVSEEYPNWYGDDRRPDLAVVSEGQEHAIVVDASRVVFTGGDFMFFTLRNVQMTLHGIIRAGNRNRVRFTFAPEAIWGPTPARHYPAPMVTLSAIWSRSHSDRQRYESVVVPFLKRLFGEYPVEGYPDDAPSPDLTALIDGWNVAVAVGTDAEYSYRRADSDKTVLFEFLTPRGVERSLGDPDPTPHRTIGGTSRATLPRTLRAFPSGNRPCSRCARGQSRPPAQQDTSGRPPAVRPG